MFPVAVQVPVWGLYSSAELRPMSEVPAPPATSTLPLRSSVAVWSSRGVVMFPVAVQVPVWELYSSAELRIIPP